MNLCAVIVLQIYLTRSLQIFGLNLERTYEPKLNLCSYACNLLAEAKVTLSYKIYCTILRFDSHFFIALQKFMPRFCSKVAFPSFLLTYIVYKFLIKRVLSLQLHFYEYQTKYNIHLNTFDVLNFWLC